ncbi:MAG: hypothetical protein MUE60_10285 [Candidatus Eisenbacteria bacterium]|nr:hypothetical protein [Candidatus Eisenbacteria bacterium]
MSLVPSSVMANAVMAKFYDVLTNGDDTVPQSEDNFFSWCTPGIPIAPGDLDFLTQGLTGVVRKSALDEMRTTMTGTTGDGSAATSQPELTPELLRQLRASDTGRLYAQAESLSRLVDFVPDLADVKNNQFARLSVMNNEGSLSERYEYVLRMSQVVQSELPEETKKTIERLRAALTTVVTKKDIISGEEIQVTEPSQLVRAYNGRMTAFSQDIPYQVCQGHGRHHDEELHLIRTERVGQDHRT